MELRQPTTGRWPFILAPLWLALVLGQGLWWSYLLSTLGQHLSGRSGLDINRMLVWEGPFFVILILGISAALIYLYLRDLKKSKGLQAFFSGLTHELKTPLASVHLQAEVLKQLLSDQKNPRGVELANRLLADTQNLEIQLDKILHFSRLEGGGKLELQEINLQSFLQDLARSMANSLAVELTFASGPQVCQGAENTKQSPGESEEDWTIHADLGALKLIFQNLFQNTLKHNPLPQPKVKIELSKKNCSQQQLIQLCYRDNGPALKANPKKLGTLFYKFKSPQGWGIGLYLIKRFMELMQGQLVIKGTPHPTFLLTWKHQGDHRYEEC